jgi:CHAT domain-containing protein
MARCFRHSFAKIRRTTQVTSSQRSIRNQSLDNAAYGFGNWIAGQFAGGPDDTLFDRTHPAEAANVAKRGSPFHWAAFVLSGDWR